MHPTRLISCSGHGITDERIGIYTFKLTSTIPEETVRVETGATPSGWGSNFYTSWYPPNWLNLSTPIQVNPPNHYGHPHEGWTLSFTNQWEIKGTPILTSNFQSTSSTFTLNINTQLYYKGDTTLVHSGPNHDPNKFNVVHDLSAGLQVSYPRDPAVLTAVSPPPHPNWYPSGERREDDKDAKVVTQRRYVNNWRSTHAGQGWTDLTNSTPQHPLGLNVYEDGSILFRDSARVWLFRNNRDIIPSNFFKYPANMPDDSSHTVSMAVYAPKSKSLIVTNYTKPAVEVHYQGGSQYIHYPDPQMVISLLQIDSDTNNDTLDFNTLKIIHTAGNVVTTHTRVHSYGKTDSDIILGSGLRTGYKIEYGVIQADPVEMPIEPFTLAGLSLATNEDASVILFSSGANFKKHVSRSPPAIRRTGRWQK